jgi:hypothetical protein
MQVPNIARYDVLNVIYCDKQSLSYLTDVLQVSGVEVDAMLPKLSSFWHRRCIIVISNGLPYL